jgi:hypothetical protein
MKKIALLFIAFTAIFYSCNKDREQGIVPNSQSNFTIDGTERSIHTPNALDEIISFTGGVAIHRMSIYEGLVLDTGFDTDAILRFTYQNSDTVELGGTHNAYDVAVLIVNGRDTSVYESNAAKIIIVKQDNGAYAITYSFQAQSENPCLLNPIISGFFMGAVPITEKIIPFSYKSIPTLENHNGFIDHTTGNCYITENGFFDKTTLDIYNTEFEVLIATLDDFSVPYVALVMYSGDSVNIAPGIYQAGAISAGNFLPLESEIAIADGSTFNITDGVIEVLKENDIYTFFYYFNTSGGDFEGFYKGELTSY